MMNRILIFCVLMMLISSCSGMNSKRSQKSDEFLVEKKNPLVMPPDIDELPEPKETFESQTNGNEFKLKLKSQNNQSKDLDLNKDSSLKKSVLDKIEE